MNLNDLPTATREAIQLKARMALARQSFYEFNKLKYPRHYNDNPDRHFLADISNRMQAFTEQNEKRFLVLTVPPRHYKSFTATNFVEWIFGRDNQTKVMTGSYNETLSTSFARKVRDTIMEIKGNNNTVVYSDIFKTTKLKFGQSSASLWALDGSSQDNYLATSPTGTATGFGADIILIDDIIKNSQEAYNEIIKQKHWDWFTNTMMQRTEGDSWKVIVIMTRWATDDLAGRIIAEYGEQVEHISYSAVQADGSMLSDSILNRENYLLKIKKMAHDIAEANYNQKPIDVSGRLYKTFNTYDTLPEGGMTYNYTDTADKGTDNLCSVNYQVHNFKVYVTGVVFSAEAMEDTEPQVAELLNKGSVTEAVIESNNGGRGFGRNVERLLREAYANLKTLVTPKVQTANKEARILASSAWVNANVIMPKHWEYDYPEFFSNLMDYQRKGKNAHDDAPDVLAGIYEAVTADQTEYLDADDLI